MDLTIEGKLYHGGEFKQGCIAIQNGKIVAVKKNIHCEHHLDVGNRLLLPTGIDLHVHFRDPGFPKKEDFFTGSQAAAFGGISCVFDMPNTHPYATSAQTLMEKRHIARKKSIIDFGVYAAVSDENIGRLAEIAPLCAGFKIFLGSSTHALHMDTQNLHVALLEINRTKKITLIHAEDECCLKINKDEENNLVDHLRCRSSDCEEIAIRSIINNANSLTSPIHICHLSSCEGFELLRKRPPHLSVGVTPHHLFFDIHNIPGKQTFYKVNPPIRSSFDRETLWVGIKKLNIDIIESDHAPHAEEEKNVPFNDAPSGLPGVETMYPLLLASLKKQSINLDSILSLLCERPAQLLNLSKGKLEIGRDADFMVVDLKKTETISAENLHSKCGWTPFEGLSGIFPSAVFIRGEKIIDDRQMLVKPGFGRCVGV